MKQKIYILGLVTALIISLGAIFKVNHWPGAAYLLILGIFTLVLIFLPLALRNNYKTEGNRQNLILYWATWLTCFVVFMGMLFKIMHWSHAGLALLIALPFPYVVFLPVFLVVTAKDKNFNIYNTVFILFLLTTVSALSLLLALSVSKERIADSLVLAGNYNRMENALKRIPSETRQSTINQKIDDLLKITGEYRNLILDCDGITPEQWKNTPEVLMSSEKWQLQNNVIMEKGLSLFRSLKEGLSDLIMMLGKTNGYGNLAKAAPAIFDMGLLNGRSYTFNSDLVFSSQQPWSIIYLDGLETNLKLIKTSLAQ
jgi:hypothetical protein